MQRSQKVHFAIAAGSVALLAACSSGTASQSGGTASGASGGKGPVSVTVIGDFTAPPGSQPYPEVKQGAQAAVKAVNAAGGADGHQITLNTCDTTSVPTVASECARNAASSGDVAVIVSTQYASSILPILTASNIPVIDSKPTLDTELKPANVFPLTTGSVSTNRAAGVAIATLFKAKSAAIAYLDVPAAGPFTGEVNAGSKANGGPSSPSVSVPLNAPDMSVYANSLLKSHPQVIAMAMDPADEDRLTKTVYSLDPSVKFSRSLTSTPNSSITGLGTAAANTAIMSEFVSLSDTSNPAIKQFNDDLKGLGGSVVVDQQSAGSWASVELIKDALAKASASTPAALSTALTDNTFDLGVLPAPLQFKTPSAACGLPRCFNTNVEVLKISNGSLVDYGSSSRLNSFGANG